MSTQQEYIRLIPYRQLGDASRKYGTYLAISLVLSFIAGFIIAIQINSIARRSTSVSEAIQRFADSFWSLVFFLYILYVIEILLMINILRKLNTIGKVFPKDDNVNTALVFGTLSIVLGVIQSIIGYFLVRDFLNEFRMISTIEQGEQFIAESQSFTIYTNLLFARIFLALFVFYVQKMMIRNYSKYNLYQFNDMSNYFDKALYGTYFLIAGELISLFPGEPFSDWLDIIGSILVAYGFIKAGQAGIELPTRLEKEDINRKEPNAKQSENQYVSPKMTCPECNYANPSQSNFCMGCGTSLG